MRTRFSFCVVVVCALVASGCSDDEADRTQDASVDASPDAPEPDCDCGEPPSGCDFSASCVLNDTIDGPQPDCGALLCDDGEP